MLDRKVISRVEDGFKKWIDRKFRELEKWHGDFDPLTGHVPPESLPENFASQTFDNLVECLQKRDFLSKKVDDLPGVGFGYQTEWEHVLSKLPNLSRIREEIDREKNQVPVDLSVDIDVNGEKERHQIDLEYCKLQAQWGKEVSALLDQCEFDVEDLVNDVTEYVRAAEFLSAALVFLNEQQAAHVNLFTKNRPIAALRFNRLLYEYFPRISPAATERLEEQIRERANGRIDLPSPYWITLTDNPVPAGLTPYPERDYMAVNVEVEMFDESEGV